MKFFSGKEKKHTAESNDDLIERLLLENYNRYYHLAYSYVHNPDDASDIVQNGAYLAIKNSASLRQPEYAATWQIMTPKPNRRFVFYRFCGIVTLMNSTVGNGRKKED